MESALVFISRRSVQMAVSTETSDLQVFHLSLEVHASAPGLGANWRPIKT